MRKLLLLIGVVMLSGCETGPELGREKYGASSADFANARYQCLQQASGRVSSAYSNQQGAAYRSGTVCNYNLYSACMDSQGWTLQPNGRFTQDSGCK